MSSCLMGFAFAGKFQFGQDYHSAPLLTFLGTVQIAFFKDWLISSASGVENTSDTARTSQVPSWISLESDLTCCLYLQ